MTSQLIRDTITKTAGPLADAYFIGQVQDIVQNYEQKFGPIEDTKELEKVVVAATRIAIDQNSQYDERYEAKLPIDNDLYKLLYSIDLKPPVFIQPPRASYGIPLAYRPGATVAATDVARPIEEISPDAERMDQLVGGYTKSACGYRLGTKLGSGTFGKVYESTDPYTGKPVAVKVVPTRNPREWNEFTREAAIVRALALSSGQPAVLPMTCENNRSILVMDKADRSLSSLFDLPEFDIYYSGPLKNTIKWMRFKIAADIACQLYALHAKRIIHNDLKPDNILVGGPVPTLPPTARSRTYVSSVSTRSPSMAERKSVGGSPIRGAATRASDESTEAGGLRGVSSSPMPLAWITDYGLSEFADGYHFNRDSSSNGTLDYYSLDKLCGKWMYGYELDVSAFGLLLAELFFGIGPFEFKDKISGISTLTAADPASVGDHFKQDLADRSMYNPKHAKYCLAGLYASTHPTGGKGKGASPSTTSETKEPGTIEWKFGGMTPDFIRYLDGGLYTREEYRDIWQVIRGATEIDPYKRWTMDQVINSPLFRKLSRLPGFSSCSVVKMERPAGPSKYAMLDSWTNQIIANTRSIESGGSDLLSEDEKKLLFRVARRMAANQLGIVLDEKGDVDAKGQDIDYGDPDELALSRKLSSLLDFDLSRGVYRPIRKRPWDAPRYSPTAASASASTATATVATYPDSSTGSTRQRRL